MQAMILGLGKGLTELVGKQSYIIKEAQQESKPHYDHEGNFKEDSPPHTTVLLQPILATKV